MEPVSVIVTTRHVNVIDSVSREKVDDVLPVELQLNPGDGDGLVSHRDIPVDAGYGRIVDVVSWLMAQMVRAVNHKADIDD